MKRSLIALLTFSSIATSAAVQADNNYVFDDPYWKRPVDRTQAMSATHAERGQQDRYDFLTRYNP